ncbi:MAG: Tex family protein [Bacilli bacterium]|nr:Tex family protein [Bacilli bacterium]
MNSNIIDEISKDLVVKASQVSATLKLLEEGNTIPFISRYRKEVTGNLDEEQIRKISDVYNYQVNLLKKKEDTIRLIDTKGLLTDELKNEIMSATKLVEIEDIYRPFKEKKKTKATEAIKAGLEPLAKLILEFPITGNIDELVKPFLNDSVKTLDEAITGAGYIIAENISDNSLYRKWIRTNTYLYGNIKTKLKKGATDENKTYEMYYDYTEAIKRIKPHRILAINRGESDNVLSVNIDFDLKKVIAYLENKIIKNDKSFAVEIVKGSILDSYKRLIGPSIEREIRADLKEEAQVTAIDNFSKNLEKLLLTPPMKEKMVLGLDPAYRTGCKLAVIDKTGKSLEIAKIYPHEPVNKYDEAKKITIDIINKYNIDIIAIGNGTASRESESFIADVIKSIDRNVEYIIVSEAGASVYSASKLAISEFPLLHVEERSAISIGRRLQDPLSELVKIDPESIGVGLYQHDVAGKNLSDSLDFVVSKVVNQVGVNVNTASPSILKYVSGLNKAAIDKLVAYKEKSGKILTREELLKKKVLSDKLYTQSIGFLRILEGSNFLDKTSIHPESYDIATHLMNMLQINKDDIGTDKIKEIKFDINKLALELNTDIYTLEDIVNSLKSPMRDPRDEMPKPILKKDILHIEDLKKGMMLEGTVRNVVDFGAFIDIGLKNDGLVHISKITNKYIKHPNEVLSVGDIVACYVEEVYLDKKKVSLSLLPM